MKVDIIRTKKLNKDNLININKSITLILSNTRKLDRVLSTKLLHYIYLKP